MAFHWKTFQTRTITAIIFAAVMLTGLLWNLSSFLILFTIIHFGCWIEYIRLIKKLSSKNLFLYFLAGILYITFPVIMMLSLGLEWNIYTINNTNAWLYDNFIPCLIIFSIWINDTMAYIIGSLIGKTPLTRISPKKTWEGTLGGISLTILLAWVVGRQLDYKTETIIIVSALSSIAGTFGDLLVARTDTRCGGYGEEKERNPCEIRAGSLPPLLTNPLNVPLPPWLTDPLMVPLLRLQCKLLLGVT